MANRNCLKGMRCPKCRSEGPFRVQATSIFLVYDDGTDSHEDTEWEPESYCACVACQHEATVREFGG